MFSATRNVFLRQLKTIRINSCRNVLAMSNNISNPVEQGIINSLQQSLEPHHLAVQNESYLHNVPKDSETHFKVLIVSNSFEGKKLIDRHRIVNKLLKEQLKDKFPHALSIEAKTISEWDPNYVIPETSPNCRGGFGK